MDGNEKQSCKPVKFPLYKGSLDRLRIYSFVLNKRPPPRLLIFGNFSHPPGPYLDPPPLIDL